MNTVTESEARGRACYQLSGGEVPLSCMGSRCMAWRWSGPVSRRFRVAGDCNALVEPDRPAGLDGWEWEPAEDDVAGWVEPESSAAARRRGFCGMAGKPETIADLVEAVRQVMP